MLNSITTEKPFISDHSGVFNGSTVDVETRSLADEYANRFGCGDSWEALLARCSIQSSPLGGKQRIHTGYIAVPG